MNNNKLTGEINILENILIFAFDLIVMFYQGVYTFNDFFQFDDDGVTSSSRSFNISYLYNNKMKLIYRIWFKSFEDNILLDNKQIKKL